MQSKLRHTSKERGQALVETALSLMLLIILLMGMVDFGLAFAHRAALANGARSGARYGSRFPTNCAAIEWAVVESLSGTLILEELADLTYDAENPPAWPDEDLEVIVTGCGAGAERWDELTVETSYPYRPLFGGILGIGDIVLSSTADAYIAGPDQIMQDP